MRSALIRLAAVLALAAALLLAPPWLLAAGGWWNVAALVGYASLGAILVLYLYPLRARRADGHGFPLAAHRNIGWLALGLALAHALGLLVTEPTTIEYWKPAAPLYMLCGLLALLLLAGAVGTGYLKRRPGSRRPVGAIRLSHVLPAVVLLWLCAAHVVGSGQFLNTPLKVLCGCLLLALPLLWPARRQFAPRGILSVRALSVTTALAAVLLPSRFAGSMLPQTPVTPTARIAVTFPHDKHRGVNCVTCHHNFTDKTGNESCYACHRHPELTSGIEATFHRFCRDCHASLAAQQVELHGPVRRCALCHGGKAP
ncbi:MAG: cytochrome c3 family protein [Proteobacteria bacterium]|nr:cytochrome c3 family protein [Pseudomonadota bacterium]